jgi:hypothetical protein
MAAPTPPTVMGMSEGQACSVSGMLQSYAASQYQRAAAIQEQTGYLLKARDTLAVAEVRADMDAQYAQIQSGRMLQKAETEARNWQIQGNSLLRNLRATNASLRARAAASGVVAGEGSTQAVAAQNVQATMRDLAVTDYNALAAKVLGFEDATALLQSTDLQRTLTLFSAGRQAGQYEQAASAARGRTMLANINLAKDITDFARTVSRS